MAKVSFERQQQEFKTKVEKDEEALSGAATKLAKERESFAAEQSSARYNTKVLQDKLSAELADVEVKQTDLKQRADELKQRELAFKNAQAMLKGAFS